MRHRRQRRIFVGWLEMAALVDLLLLLFIFLILPSGVVIEPAMRVHLPVRVGEFESVIHHTVVITESGSIFFNGRKVDVEGFLFALELIQRKTKDPLLLIKADRSVAQGKVMEVIRLAKEAGVCRFALATEAEK